MLERYESPYRGYLGRGTNPNFSSTDIITIACPDLTIGGEAALELLGGEEHTARVGERGQHNGG